MQIAGNFFKKNGKNDSKGYIKVNKIIDHAAIRPAGDAVSYSRMIVLVCSFLFYRRRSTERRSLWSWRMPRRASRAKITASTSSITPPKSTGVAPSKPA